MSRISGLARSTIYHGLLDVRRNVSAPPGRIRHRGGGRKRKACEDPTLEVDLKDLVEPVTRGDPMQRIRVCAPLAGAQTPLNERVDQVVSA
jgi:hypothetical protein